jgi:cobalamin biosynthesis protein CobT
MPDPKRLSPFAQLDMSVATATEKEKDEKDEKDKKDKDRDEDDAKKAAAAKKAKAEQDEKDKKDRDEEEKKAAAAKKAKAAEDEDKSKASVRDDERARVKAIITCPGAYAFADMAYGFAFDTEMPANQAVATLNGFAAGVAAREPVAAKPAKVDNLRERMSIVQQPDVGVGGSEENPEGAPDDFAFLVVNSGRKARGMKPLTREEFARA